MLQKELTSKMIFSYLLNYESKVEAQDEGLMSFKKYLHINCNKKLKVNSKMNRVNLSV